LGYGGLLPHAAAKILRFSVERCSPERKKSKILAPLTFHYFIISKTITMKRQATTLVLLFAFSSVLACGTCPAGNKCCGSRCYDPTNYDCINGQLCGKGNGVCKGNVCYDPNVATCFSSRCYGYNDAYTNSSNDVLCGKGLSACGYGAGKEIFQELFLQLGAICYDPFHYYCAVPSKPTIAARPTTGIQCGSTTCASPLLCCKNISQCYDPRTQVCDIDPRSLGDAHLCGFTSRNKAQQVCEYYPYLRPQEFACFDPDTQYCCQVSFYYGKQILIFRDLPLEVLPLLSFLETRLLSAQETISVTNFNK
jgi:hypothetical protein